MTVCYNTKSAIQTVCSSGGTSDSVVIEWWTSLCGAKTGACVQWLDCSHEVSGFSGLCRSPGSASDKKSTLGKPRKSPVRDWRQALEKICALHPPAHAAAAAGDDSKDSAGPQRHKNEQLFQKCSWMSRCWRKCTMSEQADGFRRRTTSCSCLWQTYRTSRWILHLPTSLPFSARSDVSLSPRSSPSDWLGAGVHGHLFQTPWVSYMVSVTLQLARWILYTVGRSEYDSAFVLLKFRAPTPNFWDDKDPSMMQKELFYPCSLLYRSPLSCFWLSSAAMPVVSPCFPHFFHCCLRIRYF